MSSGKSNSRRIFPLCSRIAFKHSTPVSTSIFNEKFLSKNRKRNDSSYRVNHHKGSTGSVAPALQPMDATPMRPGAVAATKCSGYKPGIRERCTAAPLNPSQPRLDHRSERSCSLTGLVVGPRSRLLATSAFQPHARRAAANLKRMASLQSLKPRQQKTPSHHPPI